MRIDALHMSAISVTRRATATVSASRPAPPPIPRAEVRGWNAVVPTPVQPQTPRPASHAKDISNAQVCRPAPDTRTLALLAKDVYADQANPPAGWRVASDGDLGKLGINRDLLENSDTGFRARVYTEGSGADVQYVVTYRGSKESGDWMANAQQAVGLPTDHYRRALQIGQRLARSDEQNVHVTGHSLGGGLASATALASGRGGTTFQAAGLSNATINAANQARVQEGMANAPVINAYFVKGEVLSAIQDGGDQVLGGLAGALLTRTPQGAMAGARITDLPEAYGNRIGLDAVRPDGVKWYQDHPVARHGMDWVLSSL